MSDLYYKATAAGGKAFTGKGVWKPGVWRSTSTPLIPCRRGIHYCRKDQIVQWLNAELWLFEPHKDAELLDHGDKLVCSKGRIMERIDAWNETTARLFAADCAEQVVHLIPESHREPFTNAIQVARLYARGECSAAAGAAAQAAAQAAARDAAWAAAQAAAWAAAWAAAQAAARAAAWDAAQAAAQAAARAAAWDAARAAAWDAAWAAAQAAAGAAAWDAAWERQTARLFDYLEGRLG